jgi:hypothetical protein
MFAERRLISAWVRRAHKSGAFGHQVVPWVRRKLGPDISTWRVGADGVLASSFPCVLCRKEILRFGLRLSCPLGGAAMWYGTLDEAGAPVSKLTSQQRKALERKRSK